MSNLGKTRNVRAGLVGVLFVSSFSAACSLLLSKEPLACATNADCSKYPGTICQASECVLGSASSGDASQDVIAADTISGDEAAPPADPCDNPNKPLVELRGDVEENLTLKCDKDYILRGRVAIKQPYTLTVTEGTTIYGDSEVDAATQVQGTLVITPGARLVAIGLADKPVVFTSSKKRGPQPADIDAGSKPGDWGGIFILGQAPVNFAGGVGNQPGLGPWGDYGGTNPNNDSGKLQYVRVEYGGAKFPGGNDGVSLGLLGVGDQTVIDHVMFRFPGDDCVAVFGGTVNIKHMLCQYPFDDGIAVEAGWTGKVQFVYVQARPLVDNNSNGIQLRSGTTLPISNPIVYNGTFCGQNSLPAVVRDNQQYGIRAESGTYFHVVNSLFMGWESLFDMRGTTVADDIALGSSADAGGAGVEFKNSLSFGQLTTNVAFAELTAAGTVKDPTFNDDNGFDEAAWWRLPANNNSEQDPTIPKCFDPEGPRFAANAPIGATSTGAGSPLAATPPNDGFFDPTAKYIGAFKDANDKWATGKWVHWAAY